MASMRIAKTGLAGKGFWLAAALLLCVQVVSAKESKPPPFPLDSPPSQLGKDKSGNEIDLTAYRGKVVIVTFWASWCGYCLKELPVLNAFQAQVGDQWLQVISINVKDTTADYRVMTRQMRDYRLLMTRDRNGAVADSWGIDGYPNLWIIDRQGKVAGHHVGYGEGSFADIVSNIQQLLRAELPDKPASAPTSAPAASTTQRDAAEPEHEYASTGLALP